MNITLAIIILGLLCVAALLFAIKTEPLAKPVPIKRPLPDHLRRHQEAQARGDFDAWR